MVADPAEDDTICHVRLAPGAAAGAVIAVDAIVLSAFGDRVLGNDNAEIEDADESGSCWTSTTRRVRSGTL